MNFDIGKYTNNFFVNVYLALALTMNTLIFKPNVLILFTGTIIQKIDIPNAKQTTSVAWGGEHLNELYVTSARAFGDEEMVNQPQKPWPK